MVTISRGGVAEPRLAVPVDSGTVVGIEHEFIVRALDGAPVDFRRLLPALEVPRARLDPGDRHAVRLPSGLALTCDGSEAEFATPPIALEPGFTDEALRWIAAGDRTLTDLLEDEFAIEGVSTHLSVAIPDEHVVEVAGLFARTFAPALMLLMERSDSPGLLVRPRWGRLELGGDYCKGRPLAAALAVATGGALLCLDVATGLRSRRSLPPAVEADVAPAVDRFGWYIDRSAFGVDLYAEGRDASLRRRLAPAISGQRLLERSWDAARERLSSALTDTELELVDDFVAGMEALPLESQVSRAPSRDCASEPRTHPMGEALGSIVRPGFAVRPFRVTWDYVLYEVDGARRAYFAVPRDRLAEVRSDLATGRLDRLVEGYLRAASPRRVLRSYHDAVDGGLFDEVAPGAALAPPERGRDGVARLAALSSGALRATTEARRGATATTAAPPARPASGGAGTSAPPGPAVAEPLGATSGDKGSGSEVALPGSGPFWENWNLPLVIGLGIGAIGVVLVAVLVLGGGSDTGDSVAAPGGDASLAATEAPGLATPFGTAEGGRGVRLETVIIDGEHFYRYAFDLVDSPDSGRYSCGAGAYAAHVRLPLTVVRSFERPWIAVADPDPGGCGFGPTVEFTTNRRVVDPETSVIDPEFPEARFASRVIGEWCSYVLEDLRSLGTSNRAIENLCERNPQQD